jgi:hypothetical protein
MQTLLSYFTSDQLLSAPSRTLRALVRWYSTNSPTTRSWLLSSLRPEEVPHLPGAFVQAVLDAHPPPPAVLSGPAAADALRTLLRQPYAEHRTWLDGSLGVEALQFFLTYGHVSSPRISSYSPDPQTGMVTLTLATNDRRDEVRTFTIPANPPRRGDGSFR